MDDVTNSRAPAFPTTEEHGFNSGDPSMICAICGGPVEWQGPMSALSHTQCLSCGQTNCQTSEGDESNEEKKGESGETDPQ